MSKNDINEKRSFSRTFDCKNTIKTPLLCTKIVTVEKAISSYSSSSSSRNQTDLFTCFRRINCTSIHGFGRSSSYAAPIHKYSMFPSKWALIFESTESPRSEKNAWDREMILLGNECKSNRWFIWNMNLLGVDLQHWQTWIRCTFLFF